MAGSRVTRPPPMALHVKMHSSPLELAKKASNVSCNKKKSQFQSQETIAMATLQSQ